MENKGVDCGISVTQQQSGNQNSILRNPEAVYRASSYEPGQPGWLSFRDPALPLFSS